MADARVDPGSHEIAWDGLDSLGRRVPAGINCARLTAGTGFDTRPLTMMR